MELKEAHRAADLPELWDGLALDYFQTREFLEHTEKYNPCNQRYYMLFQNGTLIAGLVMYTIRLDLFTYLAIRSPFRMNIIGIPCSVSSAGIVGRYPHLPTLLNHIKGKEKGLLLVLNLDSKPDVKDFIPGRTLPAVLLEGRFETWENYTHLLRSDYRRRIKRLTRSFSGIKIIRGTCAEFNEHMYDLYLAVLKRSKGKLETLSMEFFQKLPSTFQLTTCNDQGKVIGWFITAIYGKKTYFFMGGIDYTQNEQHQTYLNILNEILREAIERKTSCLDLGQTAEIPKTRMGGKIMEKYMLGYHSNRVMRKLLAAAKSLLEYTTVVQEVHVFKEQP
jgi:hypothetical protein